MKRYYAKDGATHNSIDYRSQTIMEVPKEDAEFSFLAPEGLDIERIYDYEFTRTDYVKLAIPYGDGQNEWNYKKFRVRNENN